MTINKRSRQQRALTHVQGRIALWGGSNTDAMRAALNLPDEEELSRTTVDRKLSQAEVEAGILRQRLGVRA